MWRWCGECDIGDGWGSRLCVDLSCDWVVWWVGWGVRVYLSLCIGMGEFSGDLWCGCFCYVMCVGCCWWVDVKFDCYCWRGGILVGLIIGWVIGLGYWFWCEFCCVWVGLFGSKRCICVFLISVVCRLDCWS